MKQVTTYLFVLLSSCSEIKPHTEATKRNEIENKKYLIEILEATNDDLVASIKNSEVNYTSSERDTVGFHKLIHVYNIKNHFIQKRDTKNLIKYSDSIFSIYNKFVLYDRLDEKNESIAFLANQAKEELNHSFDSINYYNLLMQTIIAEQLLLKAIVTTIGSTADYPVREIRSFLNKSIYQQSEKAYLTLKLPDIWLIKRSPVDLSQILCINQESKEIIKPEIIVTGPFFILVYDLMKKGNYKIKGNIFFDEKEYKAKYKVINSFTVI